MEHVKNMENIWENRDNCQSYYGKIWEIAHL
jgi:hypothetical protein